MERAHLTVGAAEANRSFSKLLRRVRDGARVTITSHGEPVAELAPPSRPTDAEREASLKALEILEQDWAAHPPVVVEGPRMTRDEIYDYLDE